MQVTWGLNVQNVGNTYAKCNKYANCNTCPWNVWNIWKKNNYIIWVNVPGKCGTCEGSVVCVQMNWGLNVQNKMCSPHVQMQYMSQGFAECQKKPAMVPREMSWENAKLPEHQLDVHKWIGSWISEMSEIQMPPTCTDVIHVPGMCGISEKNQPGCSGKYPGKRWNFWSISRMCTNTLQSPTADWLLALQTPGILHD